MDKQNAVAVWKAIRRHHPFFSGDGAAFGYDFHTFHISDPHACAILKQAIALAQS